MIWTIITFNESSTINATFNAIAAIFGSGAFLAAATMVAGMALLGMVTSGLQDGAKETNIPKFLGLLIIFSLGFTTKTSVSLHNELTGNTVKVDNIPIAIAVPAAGISQIRYKFLTLTETAFSLVDQNRISSSGYLSALNTFANLRQATVFASCPSGDSKSNINGYNICRSLANYTAECTAIKANRHKLGTVMREQNAIDSLIYNSNAFAVAMTKQDGSVQTLGCKDAGAILKTALNSSAFEALADNINSKNESTISSIQKALISIGEDSSAGRNFLQALYLDRTMFDGTVAYLQDAGASDMAENLVSSEIQRNAQWAVQGDMFVRIVDKLIALLEALIFSISPFIALMYLMGSAGTKTFLLYIQLLIVISVMPSMLVISQNIIMNDMMAFATNLAKQGLAIGSLEYMEQLTKKAFELLALGGMVASTIVPMFAVALVTGSAHALSQAFKGAAANAKDTDFAPEIANQGSAMRDYSLLNTATGDEHGNFMTKRAETNIGAISQSSEATQSVKAAETKSLAAEKNFTEASSNAVKSVNSQGYSRDQFQTMSNNLMSSSTSSQAWQNNTTDTITNGTDLNETQSRALAAKLGLGLSLNGSGANISDNFSDQLSTSEKLALQKLTDNGLMTQLQASWQDATQLAKQDGEKLSTQNQFVDEQAQQVQSAYSEKAAANESYEEAKTLASMDKMSSDDMRTYLAQTAKDKEIQNSIIDQVRSWSPEMQQAFFEKQDRYNGGVDGNHMDDDTATLAAFIATGNQYGKQEDVFEAVTGNSAPTNKAANVELENTGMHNNTVSSPTNTVPTEFKENFTDMKNQLRADNQSDRDSVNSAYENNAVFNKAKAETEAEIDKGKENVVKESVAGTALKGLENNVTAPAVGFVSDAGSQAYNATSNVGAFFSKDNLDDIAKNMPNISGEVSRIISSAEEAYNSVFGNDDNNKSNSGSTVNISNNGVPNFGENEKGITISDNGVPNFGSNNSSTKNIENATNTVNQDNGVDKNKDTNPTEEKTSNTDKPLNDKYNLQPQK
ncbi:conjugal transfer protein TraG N-terminal domain-containing protein [Photobacterium leiognathi]|uniref:conjugal transfer protein TraG N-terminal domain-containing protein n=1 Tax=Photobacterium leiognathi TaxID=553611 RepID=UPI002981F04E|nr:conjugal transfer protein TraG N-terminal domain-containing protein [Photobacterium leiognathi]